MAGGCASIITFVLLALVIVVCIGLPIMICIGLIALCYYGFAALYNYFCPYGCCISGWCGCCTSGWYGCCASGWCGCCTSGWYGCCTSGWCGLCKSEEQQKEDKRLGKELQDEKRKDQSVKKLILLGSGESGKSTLFKQLRTLYGTGYADKDRLQFKDHIFAQIVEQMRLCL
eukprot:253736_1